MVFYCIPQDHFAKLRKEINILVHLKVLKPTNNSKWGSPTFCLPKKDNTIWIIHDFHCVNSQIYRKPHPLLCITDTVQKVGRFRYTTYLDLNMGHYAMGLDKDSKNICTIVTPRGSYKYNVLPMGLVIASDMFQVRLSQLLQDTLFVLVYIDDIAIIGANSFANHLLIYHLFPKFKRNIDIKSCFLT